MKQELSPMKAAGLLLIAVAAVGGAAFWFMNSGAAAGHAPETEQIKPQEAQEYYKQYTDGGGSAPAPAAQGGAPGMPSTEPPRGAPGGPQGGEAAARARGVPPATR